jgi:hypothetical protein
LAVSISKFNWKFSFFPCVYHHSLKIKVSGPNLINFMFFFVILCVQILLLNENFVKIWPCYFWEAGEGGGANQDFAPDTRGQNRTGWNLSLGTSSLTEFQNFSKFKIYSIYEMQLFCDTSIVPNPCIPPSSPENF